MLEGRPIYTLKGHDGSVSALATSPDGKYFSTGGTDKQVLIWKANFTTLQSQDGDVTAEENKIALFDESSLYLRELSANNSTLKETVIDVG